MATDIFNPEVSTVIKGIPGKLIFIYGANGTGKTSQSVLAPKPFVIAFENGLGAVSGIPNAKIKKWMDFQKVITQLTSPTTIEDAKKLYSTIIVDGVDSMDVLADSWVAGCYGATSVRSGNEGFGLWKEYSSELIKQINSLCNSGYTVIWLSHEGERDFPTPQGQKYTMIYPRGDKRVIDPILNVCDIVAYVQLQPDTEDGKPVLAKMYLMGNSAFLAKSRFKYIVREIPEWNYNKLERAIVDSIRLEEQASGKKSITPTAAATKQALEERQSQQDLIPIDELIQRIGLMLKQMNTKDGNINTYSSIMFDTLGTTEFKCNTATEAQRDQVEILYHALIERGYNYIEEGK